SHTFANGLECDQFVQDRPDAIDAGASPTGTNPFGLGRQARNVTRIARRVSRLGARMKLSVLAFKQCARVDKEVVPLAVLISELCGERDNDADRVRNVERSAAAAKFVDLV